MRFVLQRLGRLVSVLLAVTALSFLLINLLPGDPTVAILGPAAGDPVASATLRKDLGLDRPLPVRYVRWLGRALRGDLGTSYATHQSVVSSISERLPLTVELMVLAELLALAIAVPVGVAAAHHPGGWFDRVSGSVLFGLLALPAFMLGVLLIYVFAVKLRWLPATGEATWFHVGRGVIATPISVLLPIITLAAGQLAAFARLLRSEMLQTLRSEFILVAKGKGISERRVLVRHALRPSSFSLVTVAGISIGALVGGAVIVERMFALPGMGQLLVTSIYKRDYLVVQGGVVLVSVAFVATNVIVDLLYAVLDPRVRRGALTS
ncbi:MAG: ABC-type transporter, integral rane subunit [Acidimicrobiales bacterium]|nr:ABC-type transporter, integral rane subunit [Acidimicrobiales bacterium]